MPGLTAQEAFEYVATHAGTSPSRDAVYDYVVGELRSLGRRGATISDETSLGLPNVVGNLHAAAAPADLDRDGMADAWERTNGLDPNDASDCNGDPDGDGWTNLAEYSSLAR